MFNDRFFIEEDCYIDFEQANLVKKGLPCSLSRIELRLLQQFAIKPGQIISTKQLIKHTWMASSINHLFDRQELYVYINRLRKKMEDDPKKPKHLVTIKSVGYVLYAKSF